jgi:ATP-dependent Clp protease ATP-binding subunit ClpA
VTDRTLAHTRATSPKHLLLAVLRSDSPEDEAARAALKECGVSGAAFEAALTERLRDEAIPANDGVSPTPRAYTVMGRADGLALAAGHDVVSANELLVAILWEPRNLAKMTLTDLGASVPALEAASCLSPEIV